jgi:hypothetical protein
MAKVWVFDDFYLGWVLKSDDCGDIQLEVGDATLASWKRAFEDHARAQEEIEDMVLTLRDQNDTVE